MSVDISPMGHSYALADDFLSLEHWSEYGATDRGYEMRSDASIEAGNALWIGATGALRIARQTDITPGEPVVVTYWAWTDTTGRAPCTIQLRSGGQFQTISAAGQSGFALGWNRVIVHTSAPEEWSNVQIGLFTTSGAGGYIARLRAVPAVNADD